MGRSRRLFVAPVWIALPIELRQLVKELFTSKSENQKTQQVDSRLIVELTLALDDRTRLGYLLFFTSAEVLERPSELRREEIADFEPLHVSQLRAHQAQAAGSPFTIGGSADGGEQLHEDSTRPALRDATCYAGRHHLGAEDYPRTEPASSN